MSQQKVGQYYNNSSSNNLINLTHDLWWKMLHMNKRSKLLDKKKMPLLHAIWNKERIYNFVMEIIYQH